jgi:hypothetical protein
VPIVAILGAGASRGSGDYSANALARAPLNQMVPPLTVDLFDEEQYRDVLSQYDLAHQAGRFITEELAQNDALGLEHALHGLAISEFQHHKHMAIAVPPYLQHLLHEVSNERCTEALHYDRLIERLLRLPYVFFVSLNYDVLLDRRLNGHHQLTSPRDYIETGRNWSLIKPHGSVNWYHETDSTYRFATPPADLFWDHTMFQCAPPDASLEQIRSPEPTAPLLTRHYPALAVPEGPDDVLVMPADHQEFLSGQLHSASEVDLLVIGYSGLDRAILDFISQAHRKVRHMTVVSQNAATAGEVFARFTEAGFSPVWHKLIDGDFASWSNDGGLDKLVNEYGGPYPDSS